MGNSCSPNSRVQTGQSYSVDSDGGPKINNNGSGGGDSSSSSYLDSMYLLCDQRGTIIDVNANFQKELLYSLNDVRAQFIGMLMSPLMSYLHSKVSIYLTMLTSALF
jgi:hypothetical protein